MNCKPEAVALMHTYLDGDLTKEEESHLLHHLQSCKECQQHFHELKRTLTSIQHAEHIDAPPDFTNNVMAKLPKEKSSAKYSRWLRGHPIITAAVIFFVFMFGSVFSMWTQDGRLVVSKQDNLVIKGDTVTVPEGVTVEGDLWIKNGKLRIEGTVDGDVTLVKSKLISEKIDGDGLMSAVSEVNGEMKQVDEAFEWMWFNIKRTVKNVFSLNAGGLN